MKEIINNLVILVTRRLDSDALEWFNANYKLIQDAPTESQFYNAISLVARRIDIQKLNLTIDESQTVMIDENHSVHAHWSLDQTVRLLFLIGFINSRSYSTVWIDRLWASADSKELISFFQGLLLLPKSDIWLEKSIQACRSNVDDIFSSVALFNIYPSRYFSDDAWNQMLLKALYLDLPIVNVLGLSERMNAKLLRMVEDYATERRAANRVVSMDVMKLLSL